MRFQFSLFFALLIQLGSGSIAQDVGMMWSVIEKEDIPEDEFDQESIDIVVDFYENGGPTPLKVRWIYFLKFHPEEAEIFGQWHDSIAVAMPREPDSTEILRLSLGGPGYMTYTMPDSSTFGASAHHPDYPLSSMTFQWWINGYEPLINGASGGFSNMPKRYEVKGFKNNSKYGFFIQFIDSVYHSEIVSTQNVGSLGFNLFPNPVKSDQLVIELSDEIGHSQCLVKIYSEDGRFIKHYINYAERQFWVPLTGLPPGKYFLTLISKNKFGSRAFVKL